MLFYRSIQGSMSYSFEIFHYKKLHKLRNIYFIWYTFKFMKWMYMSNISFFFLNISFFKDASRLADARCHILRINIRILDSWG